ncbi:MAG: hypothetical protein ABJR05_07050 [Balneola sp.]
MDKVATILVFIILIACNGRVNNFYFQGMKEINGTELNNNAYGEGEPSLAIHGNCEISSDPINSYLFSEDIKKVKNIRLYQAHALFNLGGIYQQ